MIKFKHKVIALFIIPLIIGLITFVIQFVYERSNISKKELSYQISESPAYFEEKGFENIKIYSDTLRIKSLFSYTVTLKNSGYMPVKEQGIKYIFQTESKSFKILSKSIKTLPEEEFGSIKVDTTDFYFVRYIYSLINPDDEIITTFLTNEKADVKIYAKSEELKLKQIKQVKTSKWLIIIISIISAGLALIFKYFYEAFIKKFKSSESPAPIRQKDDLGKIFNGEWVLTYTIYNKSSQQRVRISKKGKYYANDNHIFNLQNRMIDLKNKRIVFTKVRLNGQVHSIEVLNLINKDLIEGKDSIGYILKYEKTKNIK